MTPRAKALLERLSRSRPKPSNEELKELFMGIKTASVEELLGWTKGSTALGPAASDLENFAKQELRKVRGKAADFIPYLCDEIGARLGSGDSLDVGSKPTLAGTVSTMERLLGAKARDALSSALKKYVEENDISYKLKSA